MSFIRPSPSFLQSRTFSGTACALRQSRYKKVVKPSPVPDYPYGPSTFYKQSNLGLYGQQKIRYGNMVSEKNEIKTRRYWRPNVQRRRLWSDSLGSFIKIRVTTRVLRTIDKCGGLDEYLLGEKAARIKDLGVGGWNLRWRIMQTDKVKERFRLQRDAAGLPPKEEASVGSDGLLMSEEQVEEQIRRYDQELEKGSEVDIEDGIEGEFIQEELDQPEKRTL